MRKAIVSLVALSMSMAAYAQSVSVGPKIGLSHSTISVNGDENIISGDSSVGFHAGLFAQFSFLGFFVQPEAIFSSTKGNIQINEPGSDQVKTVQELTYNKLDIPVMFGAKIGDIFRINAGPSFSLLLDNDARSKGTAQTIQENYNKATIGYQIGLGLDINRLMFDFRYENNLSALGKDVTVAGQTFNTDLRNKLYILTVGYKLFN